MNKKNNSIQMFEDKQYLCKPFGDIVPVLREGEHEGEKPLCFEGKFRVPQMVVRHHGIITGFFYSENCHCKAPPFRS